MNIESKWRNKERKENKKKVEGFGSFQLPSTSARSPHIKDKIEVLQNMFSELNDATNKKKDLKEGFGFDWEGNGYFNHKGEYTLLEDLSKYIGKTLEKMTNLLKEIIPNIDDEVENAIYKFLLFLVKDDCKPTDAAQNLVKPQFTWTGDERKDTDLSLNLNIIDLQGVQVDKYETEVLPELTGVDKPFKYIITDPTDTFTTMSNTTESFKEGYMHTMDALRENHSRIIGYGPDQISRNQLEQFYNTMLNTYLLNHGGNISDKERLEFNNYIDNLLKNPDIVVSIRKLLVSDGDNYFNATHKEYLDFINATDGVNSWNDFSGNFFSTIDISSSVLEPKDENGISTYETHIDEFLDKSIIETNKKLSKSEWTKGKPKINIDNFVIGDDENIFSGAEHKWTTYLEENTKRLAYVFFVSESNKSNNSFEVIHQKMKTHYENLYKPLIFLCLYSDYSKIPVSTREVTEDDRNHTKQITKVINEVFLEMIQKDNDIVVNEIPTKKIYTHKFGVNNENTIAKDYLETSFTDINFGSGSKLFENLNSTSASTSASATTSSAVSATAVIILAMIAVAILGAVSTVAGGSAIVAVVVVIALVAIVFSGSDTEYQKCIDKHNKELRNDARVIKNEFYNILFIPILIYLVYNVFYLFFYKDYYYVEADNKLDDNFKFPMFPDIETMYHNTEKFKTNIIFEHLFKPVKCVYTTLNAIKVFIHKFIIPFSYTPPWVLFFITTIGVVLTYYYWGNWLVSIYTHLFFKFEVANFKISHPTDENPIRIETMVEGWLYLFFAYHGFSSIFDIDLKKIILSVIGLGPVKIDVDEKKPNVGKERTWMEFYITYLPTTSTLFQMSSMGIILLIMTVIYYFIQYQATFALINISLIIVFIYMFYTVFFAIASNTGHDTDPTKNTDYYTKMDTMMRVIFNDLFIERTKDWFDNIRSKVIAPLVFFIGEILAITILLIGFVNTKSKIQTQTINTAINVFYAFIMVLLAISIGKKYFGNGFEEIKKEYIKGGLLEYNKVGSSSEYFAIGDLEEGLLTPLNTFFFSDETNYNFIKQTREKRMENIMESMKSETPSKFNFLKWIAPNKDSMIHQLSDTISKGRKYLGSQLKQSEDTIDERKKRDWGYWIESIGNYFKQTLNKYRQGGGEEGVNGQEGENGTGDGTGGDGEEVNQEEENGEEEVTSPDNVHLEGLDEQPNQP